MSTKKLQIVNSIVSTDETLSISGAAADAKAVGNAINQKASTYMYSASFPVSGWSADSTPYTQTVSVTGVLETDAPIVDVDLSSTSDVPTALEAWGCIGRITTGNNTLTAYCYDNAPEVDVDVVAKVVR